MPGIARAVIATSASPSSRFPGGLRALEDAGAQGPFLDSESRGFKVLKARSCKCVRVRSGGQWWTGRVYSVNPLEVHSEPTIPKKRQVYETKQSLLATEWDLRSCFTLLLQESSASCCLSSGKGHSGVRPTLVNEERCCIKQWIRQRQSSELAAEY